MSPLITTPYVPEVAGTARGDPYAAQPHTQSEPSGSCDGTPKGLIILGATVGYFNLAKTIRGSA